MTSTAQVVAALADPGWGVFPDFLSSDATAALRNECRQAQADGGFHHAGVGRGAARIDPEIRGDQVCWIEPESAGPATQALLATLEELRGRVNRELFLGLFDVELHFAAYPPGAGYQRHLDRFRDDDRRALTVILYLNEAWRPEDGGQLHFWPTEHAHPLEIQPAGGTLVTFLSERFWHQVEPARRERLSLTGWLRHR